MAKTMLKSVPKVPLHQTLRALLRDIFRQRRQGASNARFARALGYADGYMQALIDAGVAEERELLDIVAEERQREEGPGSGEALPSPDARAVA